MKSGYIVTIKHVSNLHLRIGIVAYLDDIHQFYDELGIRTFDIVRSHVYTPYFSRDEGLLIYCDDEGLLVNSPPTLPTFSQLPDGKLGEVVGMIVGNVAYAHSYEDDPSDTRGLTDLEAAELVQTIDWWFNTHTKFVVDGIDLPEGFRFDFENPPYRTA